jgi:hypothetical protein
MDIFTVIIFLVKASRPPPPPQRDMPEFAGAYPLT